MRYKLVHPRGVVEFTQRINESADTFFTRMYNKISTYQRKYERNQVLTLIELSSSMPVDTFKGIADLYR